MFRSILSSGRYFNRSKSFLNQGLCEKCRYFQRSSFRNYYDFADKLRQARKKGLRTTLYYVTAVGIVTAGLSYAAVPLYRMFCQAYSYGGTVVEGHDGSKVESMVPNKSRPIKVQFNADRASNMRWNFKPQQTEITVYPGETALAFYTAKNPSNEPVVGISTYNVVPFEAGQYFNKIQCFCFEEQMLNPNEQVDMPVFFYIDPEFTENPFLENCDLITLSYTFFEAKEGMKLPFPQFAKR